MVFHRSFALLKKTLKTLILKDTAIAELCDQAYSKLSNLEYLDLSGNKIMGDQLLSTMIYFAQGNLKTLNLSNTDY